MLFDRDGGPIAIHLDVAVPIAGEDVTRRQLANALKDRQWIRHVAEREILAGGLAVERAGKLTEGEKCPQFRRKYEPIRRGPIVERFDAEPIASQEQSPQARIPYPDGEHAPERIDKTGPRFFVEMDQRLRVASARYAVSLALELAAELPEIVDLSIEHRTDSSVLIEDGLSTAGDINDAEPTHPERDSRRDVAALVIGTPVPDGVAHCVQR